MSLTSFSRSDSINDIEQQNRDLFWDQQAKSLQWFHPWDKVCKWNPPYAEWYVGGKLNACYNCLDRHMGTAIEQKTALLWEGEMGDSRSITYKELYTAVNQLSNALKNMGLQKGDRAAIYMPLIPEAIIAMLSCARLGIIHAVVFGGFSSEALKDRIMDSESKILITADGGYRRGHIISLKETSDNAVEQCPSIEKVIVVKHTGKEIPFKAERDVWYHDLMAKEDTYCAPESMDSEDVLFILYTSGSTGKPKGIVHTTGGYMVDVTNTTKSIFSIQDEDIYWCTADIGWITGHSYVVYGPLSNGMTQLIYEGAPDYPEKNRYWDLIEKYKVSILYTAPTAIRMFMKWGEEWLQSSDLSSLRLLGSVGEPINPEAWKWYYTHIGQEKCPIIDTWWQTETGSIMISPEVSQPSFKPGCATKPREGINIAVVNHQGKETSTGYLVITSPWPSMLRGLYKDPARYETTYWKQEGHSFYFTGDSARKDEEGDIWLLGRVDDVMNVAGHRLSTIEIESALIDHASVAETAAIGIPHEIKGQGIVAFVTTKSHVKADQFLEDILKHHVAQKIGGIARPEKIIFVEDLPKTRSGKIMRRLLRDVAEGKVLGDISTLANGTALEEIKKKYDEEDDSSS